MFAYRLEVQSRGAIESDSVDAEEPKVGQGDVGEKSASGSRQHLVTDWQIDSKLFEQAKAVPDDGGFYDFAVANLIDGDAAERNFFVRRGNA